MKIGIYGGSFNPPHKEHINIAVNAVKELNLDKLFIVPANIPPHKIGVSILDGKHRTDMINLALKDTGGEDKIAVSDYEFNSAEKSYTYLTIEYFKSLYSGAELFFLVGTDMFEDFATWKNPDRILNSAKLFVTKREGEDIEKAKEVFFGKFSEHLGDVVYADFVGKKVSSTDIRNRLLLGLDVSDILSESVIEYITSNGLYKGDIKAEFVRKNLPISRLTHTLGVMNLAKTYAKRLKADTEKAVLAAMLHDSAKYLNPADYKDFKIDDDVPKSVVHQFLGAYIAEKHLGVTDKEVINAIKYHTTGRPDMGTIEKIIFTADLLEEGRTYDEVNVLRAAVDEDFYEGFKLCVKRLRRFLSKSNEPVYFLTEKCYDFYINEN